jgi:hypothetical protein
MAAANATANKKTNTRPCMWLSA